MPEVITCDKKGCRKTATLQVQALDPNDPAGVFKVCSPGHINAVQVQERRRVKGK